jgi:predicted RNase H-like HicB family nuclease
VAAKKYNEAVGFDDYKVVLYRNQPDGWVAEIPAIPECHALMPTREEAIAELGNVFRLICEEYKDRNESLPADSTEIVHAWRPRRRVSPRSEQTRFQEGSPDREPRAMETSGRACHHDPDSRWTGNRSRFFTESSASWA